MRTCAFCPHSAKLSSEHIMGRWMNKLFAGKGQIKYADGRGNQWEKPTAEIDWTAKIVCETCNNTWMSDIETRHAEPVLTPLIEGKRVVPIGETEARSLAIFAFKTAAVVDYAHKVSERPFFSSRIRNGFRTHLAIPNYTKMWMAGFHGHRGKVAVHSCQHSGKLTQTQPLSMFVFTCAIGHLVLQVIHVKVFGSISFEPREEFDGVMVPFWPELPAKLLWPFPMNLSTAAQFSALVNRWQTISLVGS